MHSHRMLNFGALLRTLGKFSQIRRKPVRECFLAQFNDSTTSLLSPPALAWTYPGPERLEIRAMMTASPEVDFSFEDGVITDYSGPGGDVVIPPVINGQQVTGIGAFAFYRPEITSIVIPEGVTSIAGSAFSGCTSLASITLPSTLTAFGSSAFSGCTALTSIVIPEGVTSIGSYAFSGCTSLASITLPSTLTSIDDSVFSSCSSLASIVIPEGVTSIGDSAFLQCSSLTSIVIPEGVTSIGRYTFGTCTALTSIVIPEGVRVIKEQAFYQCVSLSTITLPNTLSTIEPFAFGYLTSSLSAVIVSNENPFFCVEDGILYDIAQTRVLRAFPATSVNVSLPTTVTEIDQGAFSHCASLSSIVIPEGVTELRYRTFFNCPSLSTIELPASLATIDGNPFAPINARLDVRLAPGNISLVIANDVLFNAEKTVAIAGLDTEANSVRLPNTLAEIGHSAFAGYRSLINVVIPEGLTAIGASAFAGCRSLVSIDLASTLTTIGYSAFSECVNLTVVTMPSSLVAINENFVNAFDGCDSLTSVIFTGDAVTLPRFRGTSESFAVYFDPDRLGWSERDSDPFPIRPLNRELGGIVLGQNGGLELLLGLDASLAVRSADTGKRIPIRQSNSSVSHLLWGRWVIDQAMQFEGKNLLFARDAISGMTHRIYAQSDWSIGSGFEIISNAFSEPLLVTAREDSSRPESPVPLVPEDIHFPIDVGGNTKLYRTYGGSLFAEIVRGERVPVPIIPEAGFRAIAAESGVSWWGQLSNRYLLFISKDEHHAASQFNLDWNYLGEWSRSDLWGEFHFYPGMTSWRGLRHPPPPTFPR